MSNGTYDDRFVESVRLLHARAVEAKAPPIVPNGWRFRYSDYFDLGINIIAPDGTYQQTDEVCEKWLREWVDKHGTSVRNYGKDRKALLMTGEEVITKAMKEQA